MAEDYRMKRRIGKLLAISLAIAIATCEIPVTNVLAATLPQDPGVSDNNVSGNDSSEGSLDGIILNYQDVDYSAPSVHDGSGIDAQMSVPLPSSYNSMTEGKIPSAYRSQGRYGLCWAFAATGAVEAGLVSKGYSTASLDLSEAQLAYYFYNNATTGDPLGGTVGDYNRVGAGKDYRNTGGNSLFTMWYLVSGCGFTTESAIPYSHITYNDVPDGRAYEGSYCVQDALIISQSDRDVIKQMITEYGAVASSYYSADDDAFNNAANDCYYQNQYTSTNHAIQIIGWDDNFSKDKFTTKPANNGAWLIKNSWGSSQTVGNNPQYGTFWISYDDKSLSNAFVFVAKPLGSANGGYDNIYQYDGASGVQSRYVKSASNIYTAKANAGGNEEIKAVGLGIDDTNVGYTISVYTNVDGNDPTNGTLAATQTGFANYAGFQTITLENPVTVAQGTRYSVVVTFNENSYVFYDMTYGNGGWINFYTQEAEGTSFSKNYASSTWADASAAGYTYRIKSYTNNVSATPIDIPMTSVKFSGYTNGQSDEMLTGETLTLTPIVAPANNNDTAKTEGVWTSTDTSVATVVDGKVTALAAGTTTIKYSLTSKFGSNPTYTATINLTVATQPNMEAASCTLTRSTDQKTVDVRLTKASTNVEKMQVEVTYNGTTKTYTTSAYTTDLGKRTFTYRFNVSAFAQNGYNQPGTYKFIVKGICNRNGQTYEKNYTGDSTYNINPNVIVDECSVGDVRVTGIDEVAGTYRIEVKNVAAPAGVSRVEVDLCKNDGTKIKTYGLSAGSIAWPEPGSTGNVAGYYINCNSSDLGGNGEFKVKARVIAKSNVKSVDTEPVVFNFTKKNPTVSATFNANNCYTSLNVANTTCTSVSAAVWSDKYGQDDLVWYSLSKTGNYGFAGSVNIRNHRTTGKYNVHFYGTDKSGKTTIIGTTTFTVGEGTVSVALNSGASYATVYLKGFVGTGANVAAWSNVNGQDDLRWYSMSYAGNGVFTCQVPIANHRSAGAYSFHVYTSDLKGTSCLAGIGSCNVPNLSASAKTKSANAPKGTFEVEVSSASEIEKVSVAVWSNPNQSNLAWYDAVYRNGKWIAQVNLKNHSGQYGNYACHAYVYGKNGLVTVATASCNISAPVPSVLATSQNDGDWAIATVVNAGLFYNSMTAAVWSDEGGQDDFQWYPMSNMGDGTYAVAIPVYNHRSSGRYQVHVYGTDMAGNTRLIGNNSFIERGLSVSNSSLSINSKTGNMQFIIRRDSISLPNAVSAVKVAVWSNVDGQDDLMWYDAYPDNAGNYVVNTNISNHKYCSGTYSAHAYIYGKNGNLIIKTAGATLAKSDLNSAKVYVNGTDSAIIQLEKLSDESGIAEMKVAVWSAANGQDDLNWYSFGDFGNGLWQCGIPLAWHNSKGRYNAHIYYVDGKGQFKILQSAYFVVK